MNWHHDDRPTLDPPGTIVVVGAGPLGIEAALYGRYLGYDVTLVEATEVGASLRAQGNAPLPMLPDRCLSSLAKSALNAQGRGLGGPAGTSNPPLPMTYNQWIDLSLIPLCESDLLAGRLQVPVRIVRIATVPVAQENEAEPGADIPPDFLLTTQHSDGDGTSLRSEAVILATGNDDTVKIQFELPMPYFFRLRVEPTNDPELDLRRGHHQIVTAYASLAGRESLDLYRPQRS